MKSTIRNMEIDRWDSEIDNFIDLGIRNGEKRKLSGNSIEESIYDCRRYLRFTLKSKLTKQCQPKSEKQSHCFKQRRQGQQSQHGSNSQQPVETVVNSPNVGTQYSFSFCIY